MNDPIIIIQKVVIGYLSRKKLLIPSSLYQTKNWRKIQKKNKYLIKDERRTIFKKD